MFTRGFFRKTDPADAERIPPGQHNERGFPVMTVGPTPRAKLESWTFALEYDNQQIIQWGWNEFKELPRTEIHTDLHCVTKWSKLDTNWAGVSIDTLFDAAGLKAPPASYVMAFCDGGYTTNLPAEDLIDGKGIVAYEYEGKALEASHGGPARLFVPHLYLWKSAKWVRGLRFMDSDSPGFWESYGYHMYGDPWKEQRYSRD